MNRFLTTTIALLLPILANCSLVFYRSTSVTPVNFDYEKISINYFGPQNEKPFPLTVKRGINSFGNTTLDGRFLFYASNSQGNFDIFFRDLQTSVSVPVTQHPSEETKPAISPDGRTLAFVSERYDTNGDIMIMPIDPLEWKRSYLEGKRILAQNLYKNLTRGDSPRAKDTDPTWSLDGRYIAFATDRFSPGKTNIAIIDTEKDYSITQVTYHGAASPKFSPDGSFIYFLSYQDDPSGEIYRIQLTDRSTTRLTNDKFKDLSPSPSLDGRYLIYTSIRRDSNGNGRLDAGDNATAVRRDLSTGEEYELTPGTYSLFDTQYSSLNNGSILFTAGIDNALNVYFIPLDGIIPKKDTIAAQYKHALYYVENHSDHLRTAIDSLRRFYAPDPLYPYFKAKSDLELAKSLLRDGKLIEYKSLLDEMIATKGDPVYGLSYAYAHSHETLRTGGNPTLELYKYYQSLESRSDIPPDLKAAIRFRLATAYEKTRNYKQAETLFREIDAKYPDFYDRIELERKIAKMEFIQNPDKIPFYYTKNLSSPAATRYDNMAIIENILTRLQSTKDRQERLRKIDYILEQQPEVRNNPEMLGLILYAKAKTLYQLNRFSESLETVESYLGSVKPKSYVYLESYFLESMIYRALEDLPRSQIALEYFVKNYHYDSGVDIDAETIEDSLVFYESRARMLELENKRSEAVEAYKENDEILSLAIESRIPINEIYKKYGSYFQIKYVDSVMDYDYASRLGEEDFLLAQLNLGKTLDKTATTNLARIYGVPLVGGVTKLFGDFRDLQISGIGSTRHVENALTYYEGKLEKARENLDLGTVYGYAYLLTNKAVQQESALRESESLTLSKKKKILKDLKQAEYELNWIIHSDPTFVDAYLLLGWIHQYVDIRKNSKTYPEGELEREVYESAYAETFPYNYFEKNVDLYLQLSEFLGKNASEKVQFEINLNLGNNFFLLNNFQKAKYHYGIAQKLSEVLIASAMFRNYKQEALFYFNQGRTEVYNGNDENALELFEKTIQLYYEKEYYPVVSDAGVKPTRQTLIRLNDVKKKIALLHAVKGTSELNLRNYEKAIESFSTAVSMNGYSDYIDDISLYNALAICHQNMGNIRESQEYLTKADQLYREKKPLFQLPDFSIWNLILPENTRVIGEGKIPGAMPLEFNHLLTKGIEIQNTILEKEFTATEEKIREREDFIRSNRLGKTILGKIILENSLNEIAYNEYQRGNYRKAAELYLEDYEIAKNNQNYELAFRFLKRASLSLYSLIEENREDIDFLIESLHKENEKFTEFREDRIRDCLNQTARKPNISACNSKFFEDYPNYDVVKGYNYYYLGELNTHRKNYEQAFYYYGVSLKSLENPGRIEDEKIGLSQDPFTRKQRSRLQIALAMIHLRLGEKQKFLELSNEAYYFADQFQLHREILQILLLQAEFYYKYAQGRSDYHESLSRLDRAITVLKDNPGLFYETNENKLGFIFNLKNYNNFQLRNLAELPKDKEALYSAIFFRQLLVNQFHFTDKKLFEELNEFKSIVRIDHEYTEKIADASHLGLSLEKLNNSKLKNLTKLRTIGKEFVEDAKLPISPLAWKYPQSMERPAIPSAEVAIEIYKSDREIYIHAWNSGKSTERVFAISTNLDDSWESIFNWLVSNFPKGENLTIIPAPSFHSVNFEKIQWRGKDLADHFRIRRIHRRGALISQGSRKSGLRRIASVADDSISSMPWNTAIHTNTESSRGKSTRDEDKRDDLNYREVPTDQLGLYLTDSDIVEGRTDFSNKKLYLGERKPGYLSAKDIIETQSETPIVVLNNYTPSRDNFLKTAFLFDAFRSSGVESLILIPENERSRYIREKLLSNITEADRIIREERLILIGKPIEDLNVGDSEQEEREFQQNFQEALNQERVDNWNSSMKYLLRANSFIRKNDRQKQIQSEIAIARVKAKILNKRIDSLVPYTDILEKFQKNTEMRKTILLHLLTHCYATHNSSDCDSHYNEFTTSSIPSRGEKFYIDFYKNLNEGNKKYVYENEKKFLRLTPIQDSYLHHLELAEMHATQFLWSKSEHHSREALRLAQNPQEEEKPKRILARVQWEEYFITGKKKITRESDEFYALAIQKQWKPLREKLTLLNRDNNNYFQTNYLNRLYSSYIKLSSRSEFEPLNLGPLYLKDGRSSQSELKNDDRSFLFYTLTKSIPYQKGNELNNNFDILFKTEMDLGNTNRALWMKIEWASYLYYNGDKKSAYRYLKEFEKDFTYSEENITQVYINLKYKLAINGFNTTPSQNEIQYALQDRKDWFSDYEKISRIGDAKSFKKEILEIIRKKEVTLDEYNTRQINDLIELAMEKAYSAQDYEEFLELGFLKNKIPIYNEKTIGRLPNLSNLPLTNTHVTKEILRRLPEGQSFQGMMDLGIYTYFFEIQKGKIEIREAFSDNREIRHQILTYLFERKEEGSSITEQKAIEKKYRTRLNLRHLQTTYLYMPQYHFKATIKPRRLDRFYYILYPDKMIQEPIHASRGDFQQSFPTKIFNTSPRNDLTWKKKIALETMEVNYSQGSSSSTKPIVISLEDLILNDENQLLYGGKPLNSLRNLPLRKGVWIHTGSTLVESSLKTNDFVDSLYFMDALHRGPGVVNVTDSQDTHVAFFLRHFLTKEDKDTDFQERFYKSYHSLRGQWKEDKYWNGWRPYTNVFLEK